MRFKEADLNYIYVRVNAQNKSIAELSNSEFTDWVYSKKEQYNIPDETFNQILPSQQLYSLAKRVEILNKLDELGVIIYMVREEAQNEWNREQTTN